MSANSEIEVYEQFLDNLQTAEMALSRAMDDLYKPYGIKRGLGYRLRVGRAQSSVMSLLVRELDNKKGRNTTGTHEWEQIEAHIWECVYCERRTEPKRVGSKLIFVPNYARWLPWYGRRHRCHD